MLAEIIPQSAIVLSLVGIIIILGRKFPKVCELKIEARAKVTEQKVKFSQRLRSGIDRRGIILGRCLRQISALFYLMAQGLGKRFVAWRQGRQAKGRERQEQKQKVAELKAQEAALASAIPTRVFKAKEEPKLSEHKEAILAPDHLPHFRKTKLPTSAPLSPSPVTMALPPRERTLPMHAWSVDELLTEAQKFATLKRFDQAEALCLAAVRKKPHLARVYKILGNLYFEQKNFEDARRSFREALKRGTDEIEVYKKLGFAYLECERYKEAIRVYRQAIKNNRAKEYFYLELGKIYRDTHQREKAIAVYEDLVREYPGNFQYIELLEKQKKIVKAE